MKKKDKNKTSTKELIRNFIEENENYNKTLKNIIDRVFFEKASTGKHIKDQKSNSVD
nr:hypothetical protein [Bacteroidota bacterium]